MAGCSTLFKVTSEPAEAEVYVISGENKERKLLGKTPLELPPEELAAAMSSIEPGGFFTLEVSKEGFKQQKFNLPANRFGTSVAQLDVKLSQGAEDNEMKTAQEILNKMFLAQKFAVSLQYERALIELDQILVQFPTFARALSMKGSIYLAKKNYEESLKWYEKALKADPQMDETIKLTAKVRSMLGNRAPAQQR